MVSWSDLKEKTPRRVRVAGRLLKKTTLQFIDDGCLDLCAQLSYYTALSLAPLVILALGIAGLIWSEQQASEQLVRQLNQLLGASGAQAVEEVMKAGARGSGSGLAALIGVVTLLFGATVSFASLQESMNRVWRVKEAPGRDVWNFLRRRLLSLATMATVGFFLLVSLLFSSALTFMLEHLHQLLPFGDQWMVALSDTGLSLLLYFGLFSFIFKFLPDVQINWYDVWIGAAVTAGLFELGKTLIGLYIANSAIISSYGAATSLVAFLVWVYYSALILFFGAEFTQVYATHKGREILPDSGAVAMDLVAASTSKPVDPELALDPAPTPDPDSRAEATPSCQP